MLVVFTHVDLWDYKNKKEKGLLEYISSVIHTGNQIIPKLAWTKAPGKEKKQLVAAPFVADTGREFYKALSAALVEQAEGVTAYVV